MKGKGKRLLIAFAMTALIFAGSATAYAWFTYQRRLTTITKINAPTVLIIGAGQKESSQNIDIGEINVEDEAGKKDFVFSVYSDESVSKISTLPILFSRRRSSRGAETSNMLMRTALHIIIAKAAVLLRVSISILAATEKKLTTVSTRSHTTAIKMCRRMQSLFTGRAMRYSL